MDMMSDFKLVIDTNGNASLVEDDGKGGPYELHVKIEGEFEAAIVGQKDYDECPAPVSAVPQATRTVQ